jgi:protein-tyrosine phosphatase
VTSTASKAGPIPNSYWLVEGELLAGGYPAASNRGASRKKLETFLDAGIRSFIDLTQSHELTAYDDVLKEIAAARDIDVSYARISIRDLDVPTREVMESVLARIRDETSAGRPVYVHCWGGIGRTGTVVGCWLVEQGYSCNDALERIKTLRSRTSEAWQRSPETEVQRGFVREWRKAK